MNSYSGDSRPTTWGSYADVSYRTVRAYKLSLLTAADLGTLASRVTEFTAYRVYLREEIITVEILTPDRFDGQQFAAIIHHRGEHDIAVPTSY